MLDVSDGLVADVGHIAEESMVAIDLDPAKFPIDGELTEAAVKLGVDVLDWILTGGEDHALAACFPPDAALPKGWVAVGKALERGGADKPLVTVSGGEWRGTRGWDHFGR